MAATRASRDVSGMHVPLRKSCRDDGSIVVEQKQRIAPKRCGFRNVYRFTGTKNPNGGSITAGSAHYAGVGSMFCRAGVDTQKQGPRSRTSIRRPRSCASHWSARARSVCFAAGTHDVRTRPLADRSASRMVRRSERKEWLAYWNRSIPRGFHVWFDSGRSRY